MAIQFLCPNGHKIHCSDELAGHAAKCPKCGVRFCIPSPDAPAGSFDSGESGSPIEGIGGDSPSSISVFLGGAVADDQIEFLCPNNHLLHGLSSLQGKPGQCPECGSRFRIPVYDEQTADEEETKAQIPVSFVREAKPTVLRAADHGPAGGEEGASAEIRLGGSGPSTAPQGTHPLIGLLNHLWEHARQGATLELRYGDNQRLTPDRFLKKLSCGSHAVFAVHEPGGGFTLTAIAWEAITAVIVKGVKRLPEE